jgi:hypothetical protein
MVIFLRSFFIQASLFKGSALSSATRLSVTTADTSVSLPKKRFPELGKNPAFREISADTFGLWMLSRS